MSKKRFSSRKWQIARDKFIEKMEFHLENLFCGYCRRILTRKEVSVDHIRPRGLGGHPYDENNLMICCKNCNSKKACKTLENFIKTYLEKRRKIKNRNIAA